MKASCLVPVLCLALLAAVRGAENATPPPAAPNPAASAPHPLDGAWTAEFDSPVGTQTYKYEFKVTGEKVTGSAEGSLFAGKTEITEGKVVGDEVTFTESTDAGGMQLAITYKGKVKGDEIAFTRVVGDFGTEELVAKRAKPAAAPGAPVAKATPATPAPTKAPAAPAAK